MLHTPYNVLAQASTEDLTCPVVCVLRLGTLASRIIRRCCFSRTPCFLGGTPLYFHPCNAWTIHIDNGEGIALLNNRLTALRDMYQTCEQESRYRVVAVLSGASVTVRYCWPETPSINDDSHIAVTVTAERRYNLRRPRQRRKREGYRLTLRANREGNLIRYDD